MVKEGVFFKDKRSPTPDAKETALPLDIIPNVLLIEEDPSLRQMWTLTLKNLVSHFQIQTAPTILNAETMFIESLQVSQPYNLIIADLFSNGDTLGLEMWSAFQNYGEMSPSVILTSTVPVAEYEQLFAGRLNSPRFVQKPLNPSLCSHIIGERLSDVRRRAQMQNKETKG